MPDRDVIGETSRALLEMLAGSLHALVDKRRIELVTTEGLRRHKPEGPSVSVLLYAVTADPTRRPSSPAGAARGAGVEHALWGVHLHYLLIPWDLDARTECRILGAMLNGVVAHPVLLPEHRGGDHGAHPPSVTLEDLPLERLHDVWTGIGVPWRAAVWCRVRCTLGAEPARAPSDGAATVIAAGASPRH